MTSGCLDRKEVRGAIWGVHSTTDRPAGGNTGRLFLAFGGPVCADRISNCPLDRVLTYKNLIYLLNLQFTVTHLLLVPEVCNVKPTYRKSFAWNLLMWSDLTLGPSFKAKQGQPNLKVLISRLLLVLEVYHVN